MLGTGPQGCTLGLVPSLGYEAPVIPRSFFCLPILSKHPWEQEPRRRVAKLWDSEDKMMSQLEASPSQPGHRHGGCWALLFPV